MLVRTERGAWVVPAGYALWMPANVRHDVTMRGDVDMRTIYVEQSAASAMPQMCIVVAVSDLLRSALVALSNESHNYEVRGRGGHLVAVVLDEIERAPTPPFALVIPGDPRIARVARALIKNPGSPRDLDSWAAWVGVSRRNLTRVFRQQTGLSFGAWRRRLRLLEAAARWQTANHWIGSSPRWAIPAWRRFRRCSIERLTEPNPIERGYYVDGHADIISSRRCNFHLSRPAPRSTQPRVRASSQGLRDADLECLWVPPPSRG